MFKTSIVDVQECCRLRQGSVAFLLWPDAELVAARSRDLVMCSAVTPQSHHPRPNPIIGGSSAKDPLQIGTMPPFTVFVDDVSPVRRSLGTDHHRGGTNISGIRRWLLAPTGAFYILMRLFRPAAWNLFISHSTSWQRIITIVPLHLISNWTQCNWCNRQFDRSSK